MYLLLHACGIHTTLLHQRTTNSCLRQQLIQISHAPLKSRKEYLRQKSSHSTCTTSIYDPQFSSYACKSAQMACWRETVMHVWNHNLRIISHIQLYRRKQISSIAEQSFGMKKVIYDLQVSSYEQMYPQNVVLEEVAMHV